MAYLKELIRRCGNDHCATRAVVALHGRRNEHYGDYCCRCGGRELGKLKAIESENDADIARNPRLKELLAWCRPVLQRGAGAVKQTPSGAASLRASPFLPCAAPQRRRLGKSAEGGGGDGLT